MDEKFKQILEPLINEYLSQLPHNMSEIECLWREAITNMDSFKQFLLKIHNMKGTAGMLGFDDISKIAAEIQMLGKKSSEENSLHKEDAAIIDNLVNKLKKHVDGLISK